MVSPTTGSGWRLAALAALLLIGTRAGVVRADSDPPPAQPIDSFTVTDGVFTLTFEIEIQLDREIVQHLEDTFFTVVGPECEMFNPSCPHEVTIRIAPTSDACDGGLACAANDWIVISGEHIKENPEDYDLVAHEVFHLVQVLSPEPCWYWEEGLADLARAWFGENNENAGWGLRMGESYTEGYKPTADFLDWIAATYGMHIPVHLSQMLRSQCPNEDFWKTEAGFEVDALWRQYTGEQVTHM